MVANFYFGAEGKFCKKPRSLPPTFPHPRGQDREVIVERSFSSLAREWLRISTRLLILENPESAEEPKQAHLYEQS
jgi:hypothetical protein